MPDIVRGRVEFVTQLPDQFGLTDGEASRRFGWGATWRMHPGLMRSTNCRFWPRNRAGVGDNAFVVTLKQLLPSGAMSLTDWTQESGKWVTRLVGGRTALVCTSIGGKIRSAAVMNGNGAIAFSFVIGAPPDGTAGSLEMELLNIYRLIIPTSGYAAGQLYTQMGTAMLELSPEESAFSLNRDTDSVKRFDVVLSFVGGSLYYEINGRVFEVLPAAFGLAPPTSQLVIKLNSVAGVVYGGNCTWALSGTLRPRFGTRVNSNKNTDGLLARGATLLPKAVDVVTFTPIGDFVSLADAYISPQLSPFTYLPFAALSSNGTSSPVVREMSVYAANQVLAITASAGTLPGNEVGFEVTLRRAGSTGRIELLNVPPASVPQNGIIVQIKAIQETNAGGTGTATVAYAELFAKATQENDPNNPNMRRVVLELRDWRDGWLRFCRMNRAPSGLGWPLQSYITQVLNGLWNIPASRIIYTNLPNPTLSMDMLDSMQLSPNMDGIGFLDAISALTDRAWMIRQPTHDIYWYHRLTAPAPTIFLDDTSATDQQFIELLQREMDPDELTTQAVVMSRDFYGRPRAGEYGSSVYQTRTNKSYIGGVPGHWQVEEINTPYDPGFVAYSRVGLPEGIGVSWKGLARIPQAVPGAVVEITSATGTNLTAGDRFELEEVKVTFNTDTLQLDMEAVGRQYL